MPSIRKKLAQKKSKLALTREKTEDHPADLDDYQEGAFYNVDIDLITPDSNQPRKFFDSKSLEELSSSIKQKGVLQPVIVRKNKAGQILLVAGERRYRAALQAGLKRIPAILTKGNPMEIALIENLQRENLKPIEEAEALARMIEEHQYTHEELALVIGKSRSTITETLSLNKLPEEVKEECRRADNYPRRLLVEIAKQKTKEKMLALFSQVKKGKLKSSQVREITRRQSIHRRSQPTIALEKIQILQKQLNKLNLETADEPDRNRLIMELHKLRELIDKIIES